MSLAFDRVQEVAQLNGDELKVLLKLPERDLEDLLDPALSHDDQLRIIQAYKEAAAEREVTSGWEIFLTRWLPAILQIAGSVMPIVGAVTSILGVIQAGKAAAAPVS
jgi:hypothetical protein